MQIEIAKRYRLKHKQQTNMPMIKANKLKMYAYTLSVAIRLSSSRLWWHRTNPSPPPVGQSLVSKCFSWMEISKSLGQDSGKGHSDAQVSKESKVGNSYRSWVQMRKKRLSIVVVRVAYLVRGFLLSVYRVTYTGKLNTVKNTISNNWIPLDSGGHLDNHIPLESLLITKYCLFIVGSSKNSWKLLVFDGYSDVVDSE